MIGYIKGIMESIYTHKDKYKEKEKEKEKEKDKEKRIKMVEIFYKITYIINMRI